MLLRDRPTTPGRGFDLRDSGRGRGTPQDTDALALLPHQIEQPDTPADTEDRVSDVAPMFPAARGASYSIPHHHQAHHSNVTAVDGVPHQLRDEPLLDCLTDRETCLLFYFCPCVLVGRTARFAGFDPWLCGCMWCIMPPCVGAVLRQSVALRLAEEPPHFLTSLVYNHCVCCVCSVLKQVSRRRGQPKHEINPRVPVLLAFAHSNSRNSKQQSLVWLRPLVTKHGAEEAVTLSESRFGNVRVVARGSLWHCQSHHIIKSKAQSALIAVQRRNADLAHGESPRAQHERSTVKMSAAGSGFALQYRVILARSR